MVEHRSGIMGILSILLSNSVMTSCYEGHLIQFQIVTSVFFVSVVFHFSYWFQLIVLDPCLLSGTLSPYSQF